MKYFIVGKRRTGEKLWGESPTGLEFTIREIEGTIYTNGTYWFGACKDEKGRWALTDLGSGLKAGVYRTRKEVKEKAESDYFDDRIKKYKGFNMYAYKAIRKAYRRNDTSDELKKTYKKIEHTWDFLEEGPK